MRKTKVLIVTNPLNHEGGIVNYYNLLFNNFDSESFELQHFSIGSRAWLFYYPFLKKILYPIYFFVDVTRFFFTLIFNPRIKIIQLSPSLIPLPLFRDGILILVGKLLRRKVIVFYRGWKIPTLESIQSNSFFKLIFNFIFQRNTKQIVLASSFKNDLEGLYKKNDLIDVTTTAIDKKFIIPRNNHFKSNVVKVLFLGRIQDLKGIYEIIDAIILLKNSKYIDNFHFTFAGHEAKTGLIKQCIQKLNNAGVNSNNFSFVGRIEGEEKFELYSKNHVYLLPSYTEGCPNSVLEALASGLYCITTNVGALADIIKSNLNGAIVRVKSASDIEEQLVKFHKEKFDKFDIYFDSDYYLNKFDIQNQVNEFELRYKGLTF